MNELERSTTTVHRIDLSAGYPRASAAPVTEVDLFRGYEVHRVEPKVKRVERCVCGAAIVQVSGEKVRDVVERHNDSPEHQAWRYRRWREGAA